jgi:hypothetical protein
MFVDGGILRREAMKKLMRKLPVKPVVGGDLLLPVEHFHCVAPCRLTKLHRDLPGREQEARRMRE